MLICRRLREAVKPRPRRAHRVSLFVFALSANWLDAVSRTTGLPQDTHATERHTAALAPIFALPQGCISVTTGRRASRGLNIHKHYKYICLDAGINYAKWHIDKIKRKLLTYYRRGCRRVLSFLEPLSVAGLMNASRQEFLGKRLLSFRCRRRRLLSFQGLSSGTHRFFRFCSLYHLN